ncbi:MAG: glycosyltransferase, partial [Myxococcota bacterium]
MTDPMALLLLRGQLRAAREAGFEVAVLSAPGATADRVVAEEGVRHIAVAMERSMAPLRDLRSLLELIGQLRALRPDVVNASTPKAGLLVTVAGWLTGVPCRVHTLRGLRFETLTGSRRYLLAAMTWLSCALAHRVICISPSLRRRAIELGVVGADRAVVLGAGSSNGIDLD